MKNIAVVAVALAVGLALAGCTAGAAPRHDASSVTKNDDKYGSLPSFLPNDTTHPDSTLDGSVADPAITSQGDEVRVKIGSGTALVTVLGPEVPGEGLPYQTPATTCTWTIKITATGSPVAINVKDFTSIDHLGAIYRPGLVKGQPKPPAVLKAGQSTSFEVRAVMETGEGLMRWSPGGKGIVGSWDFTVEND